MRVNLSLLSSKQLKVRARTQSPEHTYAITIKLSMACSLGVMYFNHKEIKEDEKCVVFIHT